MPDTLLGKIADGAQTGTRSATIHYIVSLATPGAWNSALAVTGIPAKGDAHPDRATLKCVEVVAGPLDAARSHTLARVTATYQAPSGSAPGSSGGDPTAEDPVIEGCTVWYEAVAEAYWDPATSTWKPNVNTAGDPMDPPRTRRVGNDVIIITKNYTTATYPGGAALAAYKGTVNSDASLTIAGRGGGSGQAYKFLMRDIRCAKRFYYPASGSAVTYWQVTYEIEYAAAGHGVEQLSQGYREKLGSANLSVILSQGRPITRPYKLQSNGLAYSDADQADPSKFYHIPARLFYTAVAWSGLGLPATE